MRKRRHALCRGGDADHPVSGHKQRESNDTSEDKAPQRGQADGTIEGGAVASTDGAPGELLGRGCDPVQKSDAEEVKAQKDRIGSEKLDAEHAALAGKK
ncbi:hypothetical protein D3C72_1947720 [compost metagenome]